MEKAIQWFSERRGHVRYSMTHRNGPSSYDCSSAVYHALVMAGVFPGNIATGNTDTLFGDLEANGFEKLPLDANGNAATRRGDVFIWGGRGASSGASGHTGVFVDADNIIHCNYGHNGISLNNHDQIWAINGRPAYTFYRYKGNPRAAAPATYKAIAGIHTVSARGVYHGIEQVLSPTLYGSSHADWGDNGIPVAAINKVNARGEWLDGKTMPGEKFVVPGKFKVLKVEKDVRNGRNYALLHGVGGHDVWVVDTALSDKETSKPSRPVIQPQPQPKPTAQPAPATPKPAEPVQTDNDLEKRVSALEKIVQKIVEFLTGIFKNFNK